MRSLPNWSSSGPEVEVCVVTKWKKAPGKASNDGLDLLPWGSDSKESVCNAGNLDSIPGSGRSLGEGNGNPLQYSCLDNPMDRGAWMATVYGVSKSWTILWPPNAKTWLIGKDPDAGKNWEQEEKGTTGWDGWMASLTQWTWVWVDSGSWWWTGRPGVLRFMGSQRFGHNWVTELNWTEWLTLSLSDLLCNLNKAVMKLP